MRLWKAMLTGEQEALVQARDSGGIIGLVEAEAIHRCPVCREAGEFFSIGDSFHSCRLCGSIWQSRKAEPVS